MSTLAITLSLGDILVGLSTIFPNPLTLYLGIFALFKGTFSLVGSFSSRYYFDWMGAIDLVGGLNLLLLTFELRIGFSFLIGIVVLLKGLYSLLSSL